MSNRTRRTVKSTEEEPVNVVEDEGSEDPETDEVDDEESDTGSTEEPVEEPEEAAPPPKPVTRVAPKKAYVTVILQDATSLTVGGRKFLRNTPQRIPVNEAKFFREHGWFRVV